MTYKYGLQYSDRSGYHERDFENRKEASAFIEKFCTSENMRKQGIGYIEFGKLKTGKDGQVYFYREFCWDRYGFRL